MKKVRMIVEMDEELYKAFAEKDVFISGMRTGKTLLSETWKTIKNATPLTESDDAVSRQSVLEIFGYVMDYWKEHAIDVEPHEIEDALIKQYEFTAKQLSELPPVIPKREENTVSEEVYTEEYTRRKELEYENYVLKQDMQALRCGNER